ncbi:hypothetical protein MJH12_18865 [bacterium]|nr:hypothetical protein [bacterium]
MKLEDEKYFNHAESKTLSTMSWKSLNGDDLVIKQVTKKELVQLYSQQMVNNKNPSIVYNKIIKLSDFVCPFCTIGEANTIEHYLPKSKYPELAVIPNNLIASCKNCNPGKKGSRVAVSIDKQWLHPYFDDEPFTTTQWIIAKVVHDTPMRVAFSIDLECELSQHELNRVQTHFTDFNLAQRFATKADQQIAKFKSIAKKHSHEHLIKHLKSVVLYESGYVFNSWEDAMYQALMSDDDFCKSSFSFV